MGVGTTVTLDEDVYARVQQASRERAQPFKQTLNDLIRAGLHAKPQKTAFRIKSYKMGVFPGLDYNKVEELLEHAEGPLHK
ncbi:MAG: antitoxin [Acidobacteria bacterium]|nr:antitoxin [Acidobacteriota bacterium]